MIVQASVTRLFGEFDHTISFEPGWEFIIAFGLNGVGKTKFLEIINSALNSDYSKLASIRFDSLEIATDSGERLTVARDELTDERGKAARLVFQVHSAESLLPAQWETTLTIAADDDFAVWLVRNTSWTPTEDPFMWEDRSDGELADIEDLRQMFSQHRTPRRDPRQTKEKPHELIDFLSQNRAYLIETQRLGMVAPPRPRYGRSPSSPRWTVDGYPTDLKEQLQKALAENSLRSQRLDRSFPARIMNFEANDRVLTEEELRDGFHRLDELRERLSDIGLTDAEDYLPLPEREIADYQMGVLTTYLEDNREKLSSFDDLRHKIDLLEGLVNERFLRKRIDVSVERGLTVFATADDTVIPARGLSSGEQHELVLIYNLLFRVEPGTLVLIDEPEISLHVSWQKKFLNDVLRIAKSSKLRFVIATHSPTIIGKWWSRTVQLGPAEEENDA